MGDIWNVYIRDGAGNIIAEADKYTRFDGTANFNAIGKWTLEMPYSLPAATALAWKGGIVVNRNDAAVYSGVVKSMTRRWSKDGDVLTATGDDDLAVIGSRLALPVVTGPPYAAGAYDTRTGACETVLKQYVNYNVGPLAQIQRQWAGLTIQTDAAAGSTVTGNARFHALIPFLADLALQGGGLGFHVLALQFQVYTPTDKTASVLFSTELSNVQSFDYTANAAQGNHVIVGGGGVGTARVFVESDMASSQISYGRWESFKDSRNTSDLVTLVQVATAELSNLAEQWSINIAPIALPQMRAIDNYNLGDKVTCNLAGTVLTGVVRSLQFTIDPAQATIVPTIGTPILARADLFGKLFWSTQTLNSRVANLEVA